MKQYRFIKIYRIKRHKTSLRTSCLQQNMIPFQIAQNDTVRILNSTITCYTLIIKTWILTWWENHRMCQKSSATA